MSQVYTYVCRDAVHLHRKPTKQVGGQMDTHADASLKGTGHFFETLSVGSVPDAFLMKNRFHAEKCIYMPVPA